MRAELVAIGSELLLGQAVDTNSAAIAARLAEIGVDVHRHTTVGDNVGRMASVIAEAASRAEVVLVTGGLGPTQDDMTREAVAEVGGVELERRAELVEYLTSYFARHRRDMPASNLRQADLPVGARMLDAVGTAPGFALDVPGAGDPSTVYCMPGVPREMMVMLTRQVVPELAERGGLATTVSRVVRTTGMAESAVGEACADVNDRLEAAGNPTIAFLASRGETTVRVTGKASTRAEALALVDPVVEELVALLGNGVAGIDEEGAEHTLARLLLARGWTLGVAESVTGGGLGARLVRVAGASRWFRGGLITYATDAKSVLADVPADLLGEVGPVSEEVAGALARGAHERLDADVGLAVVGVAGPDPQGGQPVGTVCVASVLPDGEVRSRRVQLPTSSRMEIQEWAAGAAVDHLRRRLASLR